MKTRLEIALEVDPQSLLDRGDLAAKVSELRARLDPNRWAALELLALEVCRHSAVDPETRRQMLELPHRS